MSVSTAWAMTTGEAGMRSQVRGLVEAVGAERIVEKLVGLRAPWSWLPGHLAFGALRAQAPGRDHLAPPWPDLLVTCGRRSTALSIAIRKASGGRTVTAHIQNPLCRLDAFDLVVAMAHDGVAGPNVLNVETALHGVTAAKLADAATAWRDRFAALPRPLVGVVLGGRNRTYSFTPERAERLVGDLEKLRAATGAGLVVTPSRRTEPEVKAMLARRYGADAGVYLWDEAGENPYLGILALADRLVVTSDSVSMISEALATGHPVETFDLEGRGRRHALFIENLAAKRLVRPFEGAPEPAAAVPPIDATAQAAARLKAILRERGMA